MADTVNDAPVWARTIINAHLAVCDAVSHSARLSSDRYFVWQEDGRNDLISGDGPAETAVTGTTDLFTKQEFDPWAAALERELTAAGVWWYLNSVAYEPETGFYHYEWVWEVCCGEV